MKRGAVLVWIIAVLLLAGCATAMTGNVMTVYLETAAASDTNVVEIALPPASAAQLSPTPALALINEASPSAPLATAEPPAESPDVSPSASPKASPSPTPEYTVKELDESGYVAAGSVNLRGGPDTKQEILGEFSRFDELDVTGETGDWYQVEIDGKSGFILKEFVNLGAVPTPTATPKSTPKPTDTPRPTETPKPTDTPRPTETPAETDDSSDSDGGGNTGGASAAGSFTAEEVYLTAQLVYKESTRGSVDGYKAVANIIYNRVISSKFPNTVEGVIFQGNGSQFSPAKNEASLRAVQPTSEMVAAVESVFSGDTILPEDVLFFRSASKGTSWGNTRKYFDTFGGNAFFR